MTKPPPIVWLTTDEVRARFGVGGFPLSYSKLRDLMRATPEDEGDVWINYGSSKKPRYQWNAARVDDWYPRACRWHSSIGEESESVSGGAIRTGVVVAAVASRPSTPPRRSSAKSRTALPAASGGSRETVYRRLISKRQGAPT